MISDIYLCPLAVDVEEYTYTNSYVAFRSHLTLLLLLNYLLVVGAGLMERPGRVLDQPFAYEHRHDCQLQNVLRVACFDDCNGVQYQVKKQGDHQPLQQLLTSLKGLDVHHLPAPSAPAVFQPVFASRTPYLTGAEVSVPIGHRGQIELPPCRG